MLSGPRSPSKSGSASPLPRGFRGIGLRAENYVAARSEGLSDADMRAVLDRHGIAVTEVEYITGWGADRDHAQREKEATVFHMARTFGVEHVNVGLLETLPMSRITDAFGRLCERAGELVVAVEFMPYSGIVSLDTANRLIDLAGRRNAALIVDAWHWARSGTTPEHLRAVPPERILSVQLCDVRQRPMAPLRTESLHHRLPPGHGYGDVPGMLRTLARHGARPRLFSVETISDELVASGLDVAAVTAMDAACEVLAASGWLPPGGTRTRNAR